MTKTDTKKGEKMRTISGSRSTECIDCGFRFAGPGEFRNAEAFVTTDGDSGIIYPDFIDEL